MYRRILIALAFFFVCLSANAAEIHIAAASDLQNVLPEIAKLYEQQTGNKVLLTFGASGTLYAQIKNGAPFDVFLSADSEYPWKLVEENLADRNSISNYAVGKLVLWFRSEFTHQALQDGIKFLKNDQVHKVAMANPQVAPYGRVAKAALDCLGIYGSIQGKIVLGENISQTTQFVVSGNVDAALISMSSALDPKVTENGASIELQENIPHTVLQTAVVLNKAAGKDMAVGFLHFLEGPQSRALLQSHGYTVTEPQKDEKGTGITITHRVSPCVSPNKNSSSIQSPGKK